MACKSQKNRESPRVPESNCECPSSLDGAIWEPLRLTPQHPQAGKEQGKGQREQGGLRFPRLKEFWETRGPTERCLWGAASLFSAMMKVCRAEGHSKWGRLGKIKTSDPTTKIKTSDLMRVRMIVYV